MAAGRAAWPAAAAAAASVAAAAALVLCAAAAASVAAPATLPPAAAAAAPNGTYYIEGVGYAGAGEALYPSQFGLAVSSGPAMPGGRGDLAVDGGVVSFRGVDYSADRLTGSLLRGGDLVRISGTASDRSGGSVELGILGKVVQDGGRSGSVYLFTGRITDGGTAYKALYSSRALAVGGDAGPPKDPAGPAQRQHQHTPSAQEGRPGAGAALRILPGSSDPGLGSHSDRTGSSMSAATTAYFDPTRLSVEPGSSVSIINDDSVAHLMVSGTTSSSAGRGSFSLCSESPGDLPPGFDPAPSGCTFTMDGRINTGKISPGSSVTVAFADRGIYRLIDPNYPWMSLDVFALGGAQ